MSKPLVPIIGAPPIESNPDNEKSKLYEDLEYKVKKI